MGGSINRVSEGSMSDNEDQQASVAMLLCAPAWEAGVGLWGGNGQCGRTGVNSDMMVRTLNVRTFVELWAGVTMG